MFQFAKTTFACLFITAISLAAVGCNKSSPPPSQRLPGKWHGKVILDRESIGNSLTAANIADLEKMEMGIEFTKEGAMVLSGINNKQPYQSQGKWQFIGQEGDVLTIKSIESDGNQKDVVIIFEGSDQFSMPLKTEVANIGAMKFERLR